MKVFFKIGLCLVFTSTVMADQPINDRWQKNIPKQAWELKDQGRKAMMRGDIKKAIELLSASLEIKDDYYIGTYNLGLAYYKSGKLNEAVSWLNKAAKIAEKDKIKDSSLYNTLGYVYMSAGKNEEARNAFEAGIKLGIDDAQLHNNYGALLLREGDYTQSERQFEIASALGNKEAKNNLDKVKSINKSLAK